MLKLFCFFLAHFNSFFNNYLFFKFMNKCQKEILRCTPLSSLVCDFFRDIVVLLFAYYVDQLWMLINAYLLICLFDCKYFVYSFVNRQGIVICQQKWCWWYPPLPQNQFSQFLKAFLVNVQLYIRTTHNDRNFMLAIFFSYILYVICETNFFSRTYFSIAIALCSKDKVFITR